LTQPADDLAQQFAETVTSYPPFQPYGG
jgi:hypothetical protein